MTRHVIALGTAMGRSLQLGVRETGPVTARRSRSVNAHGPEPPSGSSLRAIESPVGVAPFYVPVSPACRD
jgi:hypothetical protein